jgi:hypothetical protein
MCFVIAGCGLLLAQFVGIVLEDMSVRSWQDARRETSFHACRGSLGAAPPEITGAHSLFRPAHLFSVCEDDSDRPDESR